MERFKADLSFLADVLAVVLALAGLILWARKGEHWRDLTVGIGAFGWLYLATYGPYMVLTHNERATWLAFLALSGYCSSPVRSSSRFPWH